MATNNCRSPHAKKNTPGLEISSSFLVTTRRQRRKAVAILIQLLRIVLVAEKQFFDEFIINQLESPLYNSSERVISDLEDALEILLYIHF